MFKLTIGDPNRTEQPEPASFSRFVLPFAYRLTQYEPEPGLTSTWKISDSRIELTSRKQYLTPETQEVLFKRAKWFVKDHLEQIVLTLSNQRQILADIKPQLVLFEYPAEENINNDDILHTGFLIIELWFCEGKQVFLDELLEINELFRYWQEPWEGHRDEKKRDEPGKGYLRFICRNPMAESYDYTQRWLEYLKSPIDINIKGKQYQLSLLGNSDHNNNDQGNNEKSWQIHADQRTYVWTCALIDRGGLALQKAFGPLSPNSPFNATDYGHWIRFLNVDSPGSTPGYTHSSRKFERDWVKPLTYTRWEEYGTIYGFTPHSGAMLSEPCQEPPLWQHFGQMYFDQILLLLYLRTSLFRFSQRLTDISCKARSATNDDWDVFRQDFEKLRGDFTLFTNLYQFPLLSNQQQAIEMYSLAREAMDIDVLFKEIQQEINGSHDYLVMVNEQRQTEMSTLLTVVATGGLVIGVASGILGMNVIIDKLRNNFLGCLLGDKQFLMDISLSGIVLLICLLLMWLGVKYSKPIAKLIRSVSK